MSPEEAAANFLSLGISLLFLGWALCSLIDEIKDCILDKMYEKQRKLKEKQMSKNSKGEEKTLCV